MASPLPQYHEGFSPRKRARTFAFGLGGTGRRFRPLILRASPSVLVAASWNSASKLSFNIPRASTPSNCEHHWSTKE